MYSWCVTYFTIFSSYSIFYTLIFLSVGATGVSLYRYCLVSLGFMYDPWPNILFVPVSSLAKWQKNWSFCTFILNSYITVFWKCLSLQHNFPSSHTPPTYRVYDIEQNLFLTKIAYKLNSVKKLLHYHKMPHPIFCSTGMTLRSLTVYADDGSNLTDSITIGLDVMFCTWASRNTSSSCQK